MCEACFRSRVKLVSAHMRSLLPLICEDNICRTSLMCIPSAHVLLHSCSLMFCFAHVLLCSCSLMFCFAHVLLRSCSAPLMFAHVLLHSCFAPLMFAHVLLRSCFAPLMFCFAHVLITLVTRPNHDFRAFFL